VLAAGYAPYRQEISIDDGEELVLEVPLRPGMRIAGIVLEEGSGLPIAGVQVQHYQQSEDQFLRNFSDRGIVSGTDGAFVIEDLGEGKHQVTISHSSYFSTNSTKEVQLPGELGMLLEFRMRRAGRVTGRVRNLPREDWPRVQYQITLRSIDALEQEGGEKPAVKRAGEARPVEAVERKEGEPPAPAEQTNEQKPPPFRSSTFADRDGNFTADSLPPGTYQVAARRHVFNFDPANPGQAAPGETPQEIPLGVVEVRAGESRAFDASLP
jgi:hypothetical protein